MTGDPAFQRSRPRGGTVSVEAPPAVVPALAWLRKATNSAEAMSAMTNVPDHLWPAVAYHAASRRYINHDSVRTVIEMIGRESLIENLGVNAARAMLAQFGR